jgi:hypothetical protein
MTFFQHIIYSSFLIVMQLHYDHMVLVDYLISKDVGVHCAQYLLRLVAILDFFLLTSSEFRWNEVSSELELLTSLIHLWTQVLTLGFPVLACFC